MTVVMKFGGTSLGDPAGFRRATTLILRETPNEPLVVVSAMAGMTDALLLAAEAAAAESAPSATARADDLLGGIRSAAGVLLDGSAERDFLAALDRLRDELACLLLDAPAEHARADTARGIPDPLPAAARSDAIASFGERATAGLLTALLRRAGADATHVDARRVILTDDAFGAAAPRVDAVTSAADTMILPRLGRGRVVVTEGFIGSTEAGQTTTLGRGTSDFSAALLAAAAKARELQIWTDVPGILDADPRFVATPRPLARVDYAFAAELAQAGAKVLHPGTFGPLAPLGIPIVVRSTQAPADGATVIDRDAASANAALALREDVNVLKIEGPVSAELLRAIYKTLDRSRDRGSCLLGSTDDDAFLVCGARRLVAPLADRLRAAAVPFCTMENRAVVTIVASELADFEAEATERTGTAFGPPLVAALRRRAGQFPLDAVLRSPGGLGLALVVPSTVGLRLLGSLHDELASSRAGT